MNPLSWNCQGLGNTHTVRALQDIFKSQKADLLFLFITLVVGNKIEDLSSKLGFANFNSVDRQGRGGGLSVFWKHNMVCHLVDSSQNHIEGRICLGD